MQKKLENICSHFHIYGDYVVAVPCGKGHINDTYQVTFDQGGTLLHYTLQRMISSKESPCFQDHD